MTVAGSLHRFLKTSTMCLAIGVTLLLCAQARMYAQEQRDEAKPQQEQDARPDAKSDRDNAKQGDEKDKPARQDQAKPAEQSEDKAAKEDKSAPAKQENDRSAEQMNRGGQTENDRSAQQMNRAGQTNGNAQGGHGRIPDDKFRASFGHDHKFKVQRPTTVGGRPQFQYGGYTFFIEDAWPAGWAYTDDCYIDYIDGEYFLFDLAHPGVRIALEVVM